MVKGGRGGEESGARAEADAATVLYLYQGFHWARGRVGVWVRRW